MLPVPGKVSCFGPLPTSFHIQALLNLRARKQKEIHPVKWRSLVALLPTETAWWHDLVKDHIKYDKVTFEALGLDNTIPEKQTSHLSSGEKQRLGLLRLLKK